MYTEIFTTAFKDALINNIPLLIVICVLIVAGLYGAIGLILMIFKGIYRYLRNIEYIEFGRFKIKNYCYRPQQNSDKINTNNELTNIDGNRFISLLDLVISNKFTLVSQKIVESIMSINNIENIYRRDCDAIFKTTFSSIINDYHEELISYACKVTGFSVDKINCTREYFFIYDMITNLKNLWLSKSNEIIERNGFVDILSDRHKADIYITELNECIIQSFNLRQLEVTELKKNDIDDIIAYVNKDNINRFYDMFIRLGELKKTMYEKREKRMNSINECVVDSIKELTEDISAKILNIKIADK